MSKITQNIWLLITVVFAICLTTYTLSDIVIHPGHVITELGGDGGKNNYTYLYHILYGKGVWFEGMNYPYGEHIVYTDGQPFLSVLFGYFKSAITLPVALRIMWGFISLSYVLAITFSYKILRHFGVSPLIAMLFSGLIIVCSPQVFRISGHYALSYMCVIPMLFYWTAKYYSLKEKKYPLYIFIMGCITVFIHPYFAAVALVWMGSYTAGYLMLEKEAFAAKLKHLLPLIASVSGAFILFGVFMKITDPYTDRPATPYGLLVNCARIKDVITSAYSPIWSKFSDRQWYTHVSTGGEGYSYIGLAVLAAFCISALIGVINVVRKNRDKNIVNAHGFQSVWLFTAFASLAFSMGIPFIWHLEWLTDYFSVLKQFRTLGRFSWIFYYVITVYGSVVIYTWFGRSLVRKKNILAYSIISFFLLLWCFEAKEYVRRAREMATVGYDRYDMFVSTKEQSWTQFLNEHHYNRDNFQAILTLRFFEIGSEKLWVFKDENNISAQAVAESVKAGIQLHLPIVDAMMSRTSWSLAFKQVKIAGGPYTDKPTLRDLKNDKPFLLLDIDLDPLEPDQKYLLEASDSIGHIYNCIVYACYPARIIANDKKHADSVSAVLPYMKTGDTCIKNTGPWYAQHFNSSKSESVLFGTGAVPYHQGLFTELDTIALRPAYDSQLYEVSAWFLAPREDFKSAYLNIELIDSAGNKFFITDALSKQSTDNYGLWLRAHQLINVPPKCRSMHCRIVNDPDNSYVAMDELLVRPVDAVIISKDSKGNVMVNNHRFRHE